MKNFKLCIAYDGTSFLGWQKTPIGPTIEESLEKALEQILQEKVTLQAASRTDAGVHADGQVVNFLTNKPIQSLEKLKKSINSLLPPSIRLLTLEEMPLDFHPTLDSQGKEYEYLVYNSPVQLPKYRLFSWHVPLPIDLVKMTQGAKILLGTHDFSTFCNDLSLSKKNPICTLYSISIDKKENNRLSFKIIGDRFLFRMMRNLVGTLVYVGQNKIPIEDLQEILSNKKRANAGVTAPPQGLYLTQVFYKKTEIDILSRINTSKSENPPC